MEKVTCALCRNDDSRFLWTKDDARYVRCNVCGLVYENPRLTDAELKEFYSSKSYFIQAPDAAGTSGYQNYYQQCTPALCAEYFSIVERFTSVQHGRYCDVGSGPGGVMHHAKERGWDVFGVEISSWAVEEGRKAGLNIFEGTLMAAAYPDNFFDAVSMFDVLEHLSSPKEYIEEIYRILKPGGVLVVETPNVDGFFSRYVYKQNAYLVKPRAHICLYAPRSAKRLFSPSGFSSVKITTFPYYRSFAPEYLKSIVVTRLKKGVEPVQLTYNDSLRIVCWK
jgi:SAM-dependent methyltransferase